MLIKKRINSLSLYHKLRATKIWLNSISQPDLNKGSRSLFMTFPPSSRKLCTLCNQPCICLSFELHEMWLNYHLRNVAGLFRTLSNYVKFYQLDIHHDVSCEWNGFVFHDRGPANAIFQVPDSSDHFFCPPINGQILQMSGPLRQVTWPSHEQSRKRDGPSGALAPSVVHWGS